MSRFKQASLSASRLCITFPTPRKFMDSRSTLCSIYILCQYNTIAPFTFCISTTPSLHLHFVSVKHHRSIYTLCQYNTITPFTLVSVQHHRSIYTMYQFNTIAPFTFCVSTTPSLHLHFVSVQHHRSIYIFVSTTPSLHVHFVSVQHHRSICILCQYNTIASFCQQKFGNGTWGSPEWQGYLPETWPRDATNTVTLNSPGRNWYTAVIWKVTSGRN